MKLSIWSITGQPRFDFVRTTLYKGATAAIVLTHNDLIGYKLEAENKWSAIKIQFERKVELIPQLVVTVENYTSYARGINGIMVDMAGLPGTPTAADFVLKVGNDDDPSGWRDGPPPTINMPSHSKLLQEGGHLPTATLSLRLSGGCLSSNKSVPLVNTLKHHLHWRTPRPEKVRFLAVQPFPLSRGDISSNSLPYIIAVREHVSTCEKWLRIGYAI